MVKIIFAIVLLGVVTSCNFSKNQYTNQLKSLDSELEQNPKMVWDSLKKIDPSPFSESQRAYYHLLNASATDKNYVYLENDSTLRIAYDYYQNHTDLYNLARSQYYLGKYAQKRKRLDKAYEFFKQAELNLIQAKETDDHLLGLTYYQMALIQKQQRNLLEAEEFSHKSYIIFTEEQDTLCAVYSLKLKAAIQTDLKKLSEAEKNLHQGLKILSSIKQESSKTFEAQNNMLNALSIFYYHSNDLERSFEYSKKCISSCLEHNKEVLSQFYTNFLFIFYKQNQPDSARYYCQKMIETAKKEKDPNNIVNGYNILSQLEAKEGNYKEAYRLRKTVNHMKDSLNAVYSKSSILEVERRYDRIEAEKLLLKSENNKLRAYAIITVIIFGLFIIGFPLYNRHKKLKLEYHRLSEAVKHTEWGFLVTKEFITENHIAYDELERILNREKSLNNINSDLYNKFHEVLIQQKANYSGRLFDRLTNFNGTFGTKFQKLFPEFTTDELLMATMIHHQWKIADMTTIFHISLDATRKRKTRLAHKISLKLKKEIDLDEYLTNL